MSIVCSKFNSPMSILGSLLFNIFIYDLFKLIKNVQLLYFADGNTTATFQNSVDDLITDTDLQKESDRLVSL